MTGPAEGWAGRRARDLVLRYGWNAMAYQILNPGMRLWFAPDGDAVVGYVAAGGYWVVAGAPVCATERLLEVGLAFGEAARRQGRRVCYFGAQERLAAALARHGPLARLLLGAQPVWQPARWPEIVASKASLRAQVARARNKQVRVSAWPSAEAAHHPALEACLRAWLETRGLPPMHFLIEWDTLAQLEDRRVLVAEHGGQVLGFLLASPVPLRGGWLIEQLIRAPGAPNGTVELLLDTAMRTMAQEGAGYVTLGLAPLSQQAGIGQGPQPALVRLLLWWAYAHGRRFYNFEGLDRFKAKFLPEGWEPIYAIAPEPRTSLRMLFAVAGAFGGESPLRFIPRALLRALRQELAWGRERWSGRTIER